MNRNSLFGRLRSKFAVDGTAGRPETYRAQIEPLEDRKVLAITVWVANNWQEDIFNSINPGTLDIGDTVTSGSITGIYGQTAFGRVTNTNVPFLAGSDKIGHAIQAATDPVTNTVSILAGTFTESDIVIDKPNLILDGAGSSGANQTLIVPEQSSARAELAFPTGSTSGIIVYASNVRVRDIHLDGSGNGGVGTFQYHHGVTTLYEAEGGNNGNGGTNYTSIRNGNLVVPRTRSATASGTTVTTTSATGVSDAGWVDGQAMWFYNSVPTGLTADTQYWINVTGANTFTVHASQSDALADINPIALTNVGTFTALSSRVYGPIVEGNGSTRPQIAYSNIQVSNPWYTGLTLSGPAGMQFDEDNGDGLALPDNEIFDSIVNNVGDPANRNANHIGILIQNVDSYRTGDPGGAPASVGGNAYRNVVNTAGVGIAGKVYGIMSFDSDNNARNDSTYSVNTVNTPVVAAYLLQDISGTEFIGNVATFTNGVGIGLHTIHTEGSFLGNRLGAPGAAPLIGFKIENSNSGDSANDGPHTIANTTIQGPGTGVAGSVGILADNSYGSGTDTSFLATFGTVVTGFQTGIVSKQSLPSAVPNTLYLDRLAVSGNAVGYAFGPNAVGSAGVRIVGQVDTPDPITTGAGVSMINGWVANLTEQYADALANQPVPPVMTASMLNVTGATGSLITVGAAYTWTTGQGLRIRDSETLVGAQMPGGVVDNQIYWINAASATTFSLHTSQADANANANPVTGITNTQVGPISITELIPFGRPGVAGQPQYTITAPTLSKTDRTTSGNLTLGSDATYAPYLGGSATTSIVTIQDFNASQSWGPLEQSALDFVNPWGPQFKAKARLGFWGTNVLQNGTTGTLRVADVPTGANVETGGAYQITTTPVDVTDMGYLRVIMKLGLGTTTADEILVSVVDIDGTSDLHYFATAQMNKTSYTTFYSNILTPPIRFVDGDNVANLSQVAGWAVSGAFGSTDAVADADTISLVVDDISYVPVPRASVYTVTGTVNISGAQLAPINTAINLYASSVGQTFTIIENDGADAVVGTFAGKPEGTQFQVGTDYFSISYTGGTGNDVVLTQVTAPVTSSTVAGRHIFYNQSGFDGNNVAINAADNNAIAPDKTALLPGAGQATLANITSYSRGINGIMVDLSPAAAHSGITAGDFIFKVGTNNTPSSWAVAPAPSALSVSMGGGVSGADRVTITWADGAIIDRYLEVGIRANANTNLTAGPYTVDPDGPGAGTPVAVGDVFFFGNLMGETASATPAGNFARTVAADGGDIQSNGTQFSVGITNRLDVNRNNSITVAADRGPILTAGTLFLTRISIGTGGPLAPEGDGDAGIASALASTATTSTSTASLPSGVASRLEGLDLNSGRIAAFFQHLADQDTPGARKILQKIDAAADELGLEHDLLNDLVADL